MTEASPRRSVADRRIDMALKVGGGATAILVSVFLWFGATVLSQLNSISGGVDALDTRVRGVEQSVSAMNAGNSALVRDQERLWASINGLEDFAARGERFTPADFERGIAPLQRQLDALHNHLFPIAGP